MRIDELSPAQRRELQRGHFQPAKARTVSAPRQLPAVADDQARYRCHTCGETFTTWTTARGAEAHVDATRHTRIEALIERTTT